MVKITYVVRNTQLRLLLYRERQVGSAIALRALSSDWPVLHYCPCHRPGWSSAFQQKLQVKLSHRRHVLYFSTLAAHTLRDFMLKFIYHAILSHYVGGGLIKIHNTLHAAVST